MKISKSSSLDLSKEQKIEKKFLFIYHQDLILLKGLEECLSSRYLVKTAQYEWELFKQLELDTQLILGSDSILISEGEIIRIIKDRLPNVKVLIYDKTLNSNTLFSVFQYQLNGYYISSPDFEQLLNALDTAFLDGLFIHSLAKQFLCRTVLGNKLTVFPELQERERDVLKLLIDGYSNQEIKDILGVALATVNNYISKLLDKTGCENRTQLVVKAVRSGLF
jgi:DNA-binding NarL/FixJ family response regulator